MSNQNLPIHYRYTDGADECGLLLVENKFYPIRETKCFYFVIDEYQHKTYKATDGKVLYGKVRKVRKDARASYCYPTKEKALESYKARKESQMNHARMALNRAEIALERLNNGQQLEFMSYYSSKVARLGGEDFVRDNFIFD